MWPRGCRPAKLFRPYGTEMRCEWLAGKSVRDVPGLKWQGMQLDAGPSSTKMEQSTAPFPTPGKSAAPIEPKTSTGCTEGLFTRRSSNAAADLVRNDIVVFPSDGCQRGRRADPSRRLLRAVGAVH